MGLDRRRFLRALAALAATGAAHTLDLDRLLWVPGAKTIVLPPVVTPKLAFHPYAFSMVMDAKWFQELYATPAIKIMCDRWEAETIAAGRVVVSDL